MPEGSEVTTRGDFPDLVWKRPKGVRTSYWLLLINSSANSDEKNMALLMAGWSLFNAKYQSDVAFYQRGEEPLFSFADDFFQPFHLPELYLSDSLKFDNYITFSREILRDAHRNGQLEDLFNDFHQLIARGVSITEIKLNLTGKKVGKKIGQLAKYVYNEAKGTLESILTKAAESAMK